MKHGKLAGNDSINSRIYQCLEKLGEVDAQKFVRRFREQQGTKQAAHTYRELLVGAYLADLSITARYEVSVSDKTPDWTLFARDNDVAGIVEIMTFHQTAAIDTEIAKSLTKGEAWAGWLPRNSERLYQKIHEKAERYERLIQDLQVPYVVTVFGEFTASIDRHEIDDALFDLHGGGVFSRNSFVSGVLFFRETAGTYAFSYITNPAATLKVAFRDYAT